MENNSFSKIDKMLDKNIEQKDFEEKLKVYCTLFKPYTLYFDGRNCITRPLWEAYQKYPFILKPLSELGPVKQTETKWDL